MSKVYFNTETELAKELIVYLKEWGWDVYQEVVNRSGCCDIVARQGKILWAIECKRGFGLAVIEQAHRWLHNAHYVSCATGSIPSRLGVDILKYYGIGSLYVGIQGVSEQVQPHLNRTIKYPFRLYEEQKTICEAGTNSGGQFTKFRRTVMRLVDIVRRCGDGGIEFNQLIKEVDHHYYSNSTAKVCLRSYIEKKVIKELECIMINKKLYVFLSLPK